jgi:rhamnosyltransferase
VRQANVCAAITAYNPDDLFHQRVNLIAEQVAYVIIIDNGDSNFLPPSKLPDNVEIQINRNRGAVGGALNIALRRARVLSFEYLITFDQDSIVPADLIQKLVATSIEVQAAIVGPNYRNSATNAPGRFNVYGQRLLISQWFPKPVGLREVYCVITSGMLIALRLLPTSMEYRTDFLVDLVDVEFCLKARTYGIRIFVNTDVCMVHTLGNRTSGSWRFSPTNYDPSRRYLTTRNRIILWSEFRRSFTAFVLTDIFLALADFLRTLMLEPNKRGMFSAYYRGVRDGVKTVWHAR